MQSHSDVSVWQRVQFGHAALQVVAEREGVDLLHLKGPALDPVLAPVPRRSTDADVLVRPAHLDRFIAAITAAGWGLVADFPDGSPFEHAAAFWHARWGYVDVHRRFPGLRGDEATFARLWADRTSRVIAGRECPCPSVLAQRLILMLHAARRDSPHAAEDMRRAWEEADDATRVELRGLVDALDARLAFDAAIGRLDDHRGTPEWRLWHAFRGGRRLEEWFARFQLAGGWRERARLALRMLRVNRPHLALELGHTPTRRELVEANVARLARAGRDIVRTGRDLVGRLCGHGPGNRDQRRSGGPR